MLLLCVFCVGEFKLNLTIECFIFSYAANNTVSILLQARGVNYLHHRNPPIVHRDLKSSNLLVDKNWCVKVMFNG